MSFPLINVSQFFDSSGAPLANGTIEFRSPADDTYIDTFPTADDADAQTNANANPLTLNARGEAASGIYLEDGVKYKITLRNEWPDELTPGAIVWTQDDVLCPIALPYLQTAAESSAGVTPTNVEYPPGNVLRYGTNTTPGTTDMTTAIQNAIDVMTTAGGGRVYIPEGTYLVAQDGANAHCLDLGGANNVDIVGESRNSTIIFTEASTGSSVRTFSTLSAAVDGLAIRSLTVDGNKANNGVDEQRHGIFLSSATNVLVDDVLSKNCTGDGLYLHSGTQYVVVRNCYFTDNERNGMTVGGTGPSDITVEGCFIYDNDAQAFDSEATGAAAVLDNYTISGCRLESGPLPVSMGGVVDRLGVGWRLTNNFIKATGDEAIRCIYAKDAIISDNHIEVAAGAYGGVEIYSLNTNVLVSNNYILSPNTAGTLGAITITGTSDTNRSDRVVVTGNIIETTGGTGQNGIRCNGSPRHLNVNGNQFIGDGGTGGGIVVRSTYALDTISITGNTLINTGAVGVQIVSNAQDIELVNISGNSIYDDQAVATVVDAIRFDLVGTITEVVCNNNASSSTITDHVHGLAGLNIVSGHYGTDPIAQQTGVAVTAAGVHAALVNLGLITA